MDPRLLRPLLPCSQYTGFCSMQDTDTCRFVVVFFFSFLLLHGVVQTAAPHAIEDAWDPQTVAHSFHKQTNKCSFVTFLPCFGHECESLKATCRKGMTTPFFFFFETVWEEVSAKQINKLSPIVRPWVSPTFCVHLVGNVLSPKSFQLNDWPSVQEDSSYPRKTLLPSRLCQKRVSKMLSCSLGDIFYN